MLRFTIVSAILFVVGSLVRQNSPQSLLGILEGLGFLGLSFSAVVYSWRALRFLLRRLLWKVRTKLFVSFTFVGLIPVVILSIIAWYSITLIFRQLSVVYLENEFREISEQLHREGQDIVLRFYESGDKTKSSLSRLMAAAHSSLVKKEQGMEDAVFQLFGRQGSDSTSGYTLEVSSPAAGDLPVPLIPPWASNGFSGMAFVGEEEIHFRCLIPIKGEGDSYILSLDLPLNRALIGRILQDTEITDLRLVNNSTDDTISKFFAGESRFLNLRWGHVLRSTIWDSASSPHTKTTGLLLEVPLEVLVSRYFTEASGFGSFIVVLIMILGVVFVLVEIGSLVVGVAIARSITRSIHQIDTGARNIRAGNFDFRIPSRNRDQLDSMATAFNQMSESIVDLMNQVSEKERLEKEVEIAREVQAHLFPRELPHIPRLQLAGTCLPARSVSGDYYDFIPYGDRRLDIVIADISGKGISAALLMASLQSSFRSHIIHQNRFSGDDGISEAVGKLNYQLYRHTSPDKFATLVLARVDAENMSLTYCNAGHNPPLLVSNGSVRRLTQGGIVAGIFADPIYEEETIDLQPGDLLTFYTDGVVEAENPQGDQFGEDRLEQLVTVNSFLTADDMRALILSEVNDWMEGREQRDDITIVTLKIDPSLRSLQQSESRSDASRLDLPSTPTGSLPDKS